MDKIFVNAGHYKEDSGGIKNGIKESELAMQIRDRLKLKLNKTDFEVLYIPDDLDLRHSIDFVNETCSENDLAISIHLNFNKNKNIKGVEVYYSENCDLARVFAKHISELTSMVNRGERHDSESFVGSLGWLRQPKCRTVLIEAGYMSNCDDFERLRMPHVQELIADGIINAIMEVGVNKELKGLLSLVIGLLGKLIALLTNKLSKKYGFNNKR